ncbi:protein kilB [Streptomyces minutiscleroticus]|uniref:Protein kilB n=1 Tax=Streptomyces minutiscleroticus TaxID=68238 RepID=A0A918NZ31_9ACTN|nr:protein kilB [Streptomyces minutiscleroticus]GGY07250.1 hypothetical protein GCM10010358_70460 [Streptomyces minutiscleroticus]
MGETVIAVVGTLLGGALTALFQSRSARTAYRADRAARRADDLRAALGALVAAIGDHRRSMWHREHLRLTGASDDDLVAARAASHATRSAVTAPLVSVAILEPDLAGAARHAAQSAFDMRDAADLNALVELRANAIAATDALVDAAGRLLRQKD